MVHHPASNVTLRVNFHLIGTVLTEEAHEFEELLAKNQHRLRDQAIAVIRGDFEDFRKTQTLDQICVVNVASTAARESSSMNSSRVFGYSGSSGT